MTELSKPQTANDLPRPFARIGESGWADRARDLLNLYGVPLPRAVPTEEVQAAETRLGIVLPEAHRRFLLELGPVDLDTFRFFAPGEIDFLTGFWAKDGFSPGDLSLLPRMLAVTEYCGTEDPFALHVETGECARCGHDPRGFSSWLPSFDTLVQLAFLHLPSGYYGWPDEEVEALVQQEASRLWALDR
jgi:hypothetical protein